MPYQPTAEQQAVIDEDAPIVVVLGGAGCGKTSTAAAAASKRLNEQEVANLAARAATPIGTAPHHADLKRVLFISFSRTAVSQILDRAAGVLGTHQRNVDVVTFHGLAWRILNSFGRHYGYPHPLRVQSAAETSLSSATFPGLTYAQLVPEATKLLNIPAVREYYERRYGTVICDEFQDTSDAEWAFVQAVAPSGQRILLGDPNQCIYASMKHIDPHDRVADAARLPGSVTLTLPPLSHRDPSGVLPAAALAAMERRFADPAIAHAVSSGRVVLHRVPTQDLAEGVARVVGEERAENNSVSIYTHTHAATAELSTRLSSAGIVHEQVGFTESFGDALQAQYEILGTVLGERRGGRRALAVYVQSISRGRLEKQIPVAIVNRTMPKFEEAIKEIIRGLQEVVGPPPDLDELLLRTGSIHKALSLPRGEETWLGANRQLRRSLRLLERGGTFADVGAEVEELRSSTLVGFQTNRPRPVQLMNLHQTKGREADATVLMLQADEYHGSEGEPFATGSRLLYVCLTRARERAHIVLPDDASVHGLWSPFITACDLALLL